MPEWNQEDKNHFLSTWCINKPHKKNIRKMFDLHCNNKNPWTWDYQWVYSCWRTNSFGIIPQKNLVSNIGIGPDASNTKSKIPIDLYPSQLSVVNFPMTHPIMRRNLEFEKAYFEANHLSFRRKFINLFKKLFNLIKQHLPLKFKDFFRWLKHPHYSFLRLCIILSSRKKIMSGPFSGLFFDIPNFNTAMMMGIWEKELHDLFIRININREILCIGAAEGYYAVSLAKLYPSVKVYAYESLLNYRKQLRNNAIRNNCKNIEILGNCVWKDLKIKLSNLNSDPLIICDIEGGEIDLLDIHKVPELISARILVEVHEMYVNQCEEKLLKRFSKTHSAIIINGQERCITDLPHKLNFIKLFASKSQILSLMSEGRPFPMNWVYFTPICP